MQCGHTGTDSPSPAFRFTIQSESQRESEVHQGAIAMPVHDWTRVDAGVFHSFHAAWITHLMGRFNGGLLPAGYYALAEQHASKRIADILTLEVSEPSPPWNPVLRDRAVAVADSPPKVDLKLVADAKAAYRTLRRTLTIRHVSGHRVVALLEIVSPGNIDRASSVQEFVAKIDSAIEAGLHVLAVDLFPPGKHDPEGIHGAIWAPYASEAHQVPSDRPLTLSSYVGFPVVEAYVKHLAVGAAIPDMPLFIDTDCYVEVPLDATYGSAFQDMPAFWREVVEGVRKV